MKQLTFLILSFIVLSSCRKDFAYFQRSKDLSNSLKKNIIKPEVQVITNEPNLTVSIDDSPPISNQTDFFSNEIKTIETKNTLLDDDRKKRKKQRNVGKSEGVFMDKIFPNQTHKDKKTNKKHRNPVPLNSTIYTGFIILGIAILLALVSLNSLSLLFGLASIIFLYLGFKKYFRKKRRRDIFR